MTLRFLFSFVIIEMVNYVVISDVFQVCFLQKYAFENQTRYSLGCKRKAVIISGPEIIKLFSFSTQLSTKFIMLINVKMPIIVGILTFVSMINTTSECLNH